MEFKVGDVVMLKSISPRMTVCQIKPGGKIVCAWYEAGAIKEWEFFQDMLALYK